MALMSRFLGWALVLLLVPCCSGEPSAPPTDAGVDAFTVDARTMFGVWKLSSVSIPAGDAGLALTTSNQTVADPQTGNQVSARANGLLDITNDPQEIALVRVVLFDDRFLGENPSDRALVSAIASETPDSLILGTGESLRTSWDPKTDLLTVTEPAGAMSAYARYEHTARHQTLTLQGQVTISDQGTWVPLAHPRAALAFLVRDGNGVVFREVPDGDVALPSTFGKNPSDVTTFDLSRQSGPVGLERIPFGDTGNLALALVVVYDDRDEDGLLGTLYDSCKAEGKDCVRGVSSLVVAYRLGSSPELSLSPFSFLRTGWTWAVWADDARTPEKRRGLVSCDSMTPSIPPDVRLPRDPRDVVVPLFAL